MNNELIRKIEELKKSYIDKIEQLNADIQKYSDIKQFIEKYKSGFFSYELLSSFYHFLNIDKDLEYFRKVNNTYKLLKDKYPERCETYKEVLDNLYEIIKEKYVSLDKSKEKQKQIEELNRKIALCDKVIGVLNNSHELVSVSEIEFMLSDNIDYELVVGLTIALQNIYERKIKKEVIKEERKEAIEDEIRVEEDKIYPELSNLPIQSKINIYETASSLEESKRLVSFDASNSNNKEELSAEREYLEKLNNEEKEEDKKNTETAILPSCEEILTEWNSEYLETYKSVLALLSILNTKYDELDYQKYNDEGFLLYTKLNETFNIFVNTVEDYYKALKTQEEVEIYQELLIDDFNELNKAYIEITNLLNKENVTINENKLENKLIYVTTSNNTPCAMSDIKKIPKEYYKTIKELLDSIRNNTFRDSKPCNVSNKIKGVSVVRHTQKKLRIVYKRVKDNFYAILGIYIKKDDMSKDYLEFVTRRYEYYLNNEQEITRLLSENMLEFTQIEDGITSDLYNNLGFSLITNGRNRGEKNE